MLCRLYRFSIERHIVSADYYAMSVLLTDCPVIVRRARAARLIHLAWYAERRKYWSLPLNLRWLEISVRSAEAFCAGGGRKVVAWGTCAEYDWAYSCYREDTTPCVPVSIVANREP